MFSYLAIELHKTSQHCCISVCNTKAEGVTTNLTYFALLTNQSLVIYLFTFFLIWKVTPDYKNHLSQTRLTFSGRCLLAQQANTGTDPFLCIWTRTGPVNFIYIFIHTHTHTHTNSIHLEFQAFSLLHD